MEFYWKKPDDCTLMLIGYERIIIAKASWDFDTRCWHMESTWIDHDSDLCKDFGQYDIENVKTEILQQLKIACEGKIAWYKGQIEELESVSANKNTN